MIDLILKDVKDEYAQENFFRLRNFLGEQVLFDGDFKLFDITIPKKDDNFKVLHGLTFTPADIISLSGAGDLNYYFKFQNFDKQYMYISAHGPVRIRFLAGKLKDPIKNIAASEPFSFVAPGDIVGPASPGFVYGGVDAKTSGFWLTSEGIPSNVVGVPVLFGDAVVRQAAVGTQDDVPYVIGVYQHEGGGVNLTKLGEFAVTAGGVKRVDLSFPILYSSNNVQLACRLESGNTMNLKVSLVVKGTAI
jgi:hypothetical protein